MDKKEKQTLEKIFGPVSISPWKCNWRTCAHGMGLAGSGKCSFGDPLDKDCPNFQDEKKFLENWRKENV